MNTQTAPDLSQRILTALLAGLVTVPAVVAVVASGAETTLDGLAHLQLHPARLLTDFSAAAGESAALANAALVALIGLVLVRASGIRVAGPTMAAVLTMYGFGLFGKTPLNVLPIIAGVAIAARLAKKTFREYILIALFGTALGPVVSAVAVELVANTTLGLAAGIVAGLVTGALLPAAAIAMLRLHQGYSLYNIGLTSGFVGVFAAGLMLADGSSFRSLALWNPTPAPVLRWTTPAISVVLLAVGLWFGRGSVRKDYRKLLRLPGRLPSDFIDMASAPAGLVNMGLLGLIFWGYCLLVGAPLNGPVVGGLMTVVGFGSFGKHPRNTIPIVVGIVIATLVYGRELSAPGPVLAALFGTTLAPLAGSFGPLVGILAGFVHLTLVLRTGAWHAGLTLYNNGFAGGLTAALIVSVIEWWPSDVGRREGHTTWEGKR